ncbi:MAG: hypothetical protein GY804_02700, partial [Alphaproteobacteria bacterium]|nr:hypothetical protein [Alphaproteobacteria bacterium]
ARDVRKIICRDISMDVDMVNCHFVMAVIIARDVNIKCKWIEQYVENREEFIKEITDINDKWNRDNVKSALLAILNGGRADYNAMNKTEGLHGLYHDCAKYRYHVCCHYLRLYEMNCEFVEEKYKREKSIWSRGGRITKRPYKRDPVFTTSSEVLQMKERMCIDIIYNECARQGYTPHNAASLLFDGIHVVDLKKDKRSLVRILEKKLFEAHNYKIKIKIKPFKSEFDNFDKKRMNMQFNDFKGICGKKANNLKKNKEWANYTSISKEYTSDHDIIKPDVITYGRYVPSFIKYLRNNETLFVKSPMATGKTHNLYEWFNTLFDHHSIALVTFRQTLAHKFHANLLKKGYKFSHYLIEQEGGYIETFYKDHYPRLIIQVNSLKKLHGKYDVIVLDEFSYTLDTVVGFCKERRLVMERFDDLVRNAKYVLCMDAYLTPTCIKYVNNLRPHCRSLTICNHFTEPQGRVFFIGLRLFIAKMEMLLLAGKKVALMTSSKRFLDKTVSPIVKEMFKNTGKKFLLITSTNKYKTKKESDLEEDVITTEISPGAFIEKKSKRKSLVEYTKSDCEEWKEFDFVAYTPTIAAGISFDLSNVFHTRFGYFNSLSAAADLCTQMCFRIRNPDNQDLYISVSDTARNLYPTEYDDIDEFLDHYYKTPQSMRESDMPILSKLKLEFDSGVDALKKTVYYEVVRDCMRKRFMSHNNFTGRMIYYLGYQGFHPGVHQVTEE